MSNLVAVDVAILPPPDITARAIALSAALAAALKSDAAVKSFNNMGFKPGGGTPGPMKAQIEADPRAIGGGAEVCAPPTPGGAREGTPRPAPSARARQAKARPRNMLDQIGWAVTIASGSAGLTVFAAVLVTVTLGILLRAAIVFVFTDRTRHTLAALALSRLPKLECDSSATFGTIPKRRISSTASTVQT